MQSAISDYTTAVSLNPNAVLAFVNRGVVHRILNNLTSALADFTKAISLKQTDLDLAEALYNRGVISMICGELDKAATDLQEAIEIAPNHVMARTSLIGVFQMTGHFTEAEEQESIAKNLVARDTEYNRACFEATVGNTELALELLKTGLEKRQATRSWAQLDPDLENIRRDPRFQEIVGN